MLHVFASFIVNRYCTWRDTMNKICTVCGKPFKGSSDIVTCPDCRGTVLKQRTFGTNNCVWCGKEFVYVIMHVWRRIYHAKSMQRVRKGI